MSNKIEERKEFELKADELFEVCQNTLKSLKHKIKESNVAIGQLTSTKSSLSAFVKFEIEITPISANESAIQIKAYPCNGFGNPVPFGYKKAVQKRLGEFWLVFEKIVQRKKIQYGD